MEFYKIITLVLLCIIWGVNIAASLPTFGDEFVHIKLHIPEDVPNTHGHLKATHEGSPEYPHTSRKVIHHYHRRRRPFKKQPQLDKEPLFESVILAELDKPHVQEHEAVEEPFEETFVVKEQHSVPKVNTFTVIEETVRKPLATFTPKQHVETFKVIETKIRQPKPGYGGTSRPHVETIELVEDNRYDYHAQKSGHGTQSHVEVIKLVKDDPRHLSPHPLQVENHQHYHNSQTYRESDDPGYTKPPKYLPSEEYQDMEDANYPYKEDYHQHFAHDSKPEHHYVYEKPQVETVIKSQHNTKYSKYHENDAIQDYEYPKPGHHAHEPVEVIKTKYTEKYYHTPDYQKSKGHYDYTTPHKELNEVEERDYPKHRGHYGNHREEYEDHTAHEPTDAIKTKYTEKYYHSPDYEKSKSHYDYTSPHKELNELDEEYGDHRETVENRNYHYSPKGTDYVGVGKPTAINSNHVEYGRPTVQGDYKKISKTYVKTGEYTNPSASYGDVHTPHTKYGNIDDLQNPVNNYDYSPQTATDDTGYHSTHDEYPEVVTTGYQYKKPSSQSTTSYYSAQSQEPTKTDQFKASQQYQEENLSEQQIPFTDNPIEFRDSPKHREEAFDSTSAHQNTLLDELSSANVEKHKLKSNIDWPDGVRPAAVETYDGYDSYSAAHVQGLGSGGYNYPTTAV